MTDGFIPAHGGYAHLLSYRKAEIVYDATYYFADRFVGRATRTHDQMVQAARSGKQNIIEGSMASALSKEIEIRLTSVARASLEELLADFRDFLRTRRLREWPPDHPGIARQRALHRIQGASYETFRAWVEVADAEQSANVIIGMIRVTSLLLDRQIQRLQRDFLDEGGLRERMAAARRRILGRA